MNQPSSYSADSLTTPSCHGHSFPCFFLAPCNNYHHFSRFGDQLYGPVRPAPRAWGQRPPRARACWLGTPNSDRGAKKVHKYRNRAPERARMTADIGTHLFVGLILIRELMVSRTNCPSPSRNSPPFVGSGDRFREILTIFQFCGRSVLRCGLVSFIFARIVVD